MCGDKYGDKYGDGHAKETRAAGYLPTTKLTSLHPFPNQSKLIAPTLSPFSPITSRYTPITSRYNSHNL